MKKLIVLCALCALCHIAGCQSYQGRIDIPAGRTIAIGEIQSNDVGASGVFKTLLEKKLEKKGFVFSDEPEIQITGSIAYIEAPFSPYIGVAAISAGRYGVIMKNDVWSFDGWALKDFTDEIAKRINAP